MALTKRMRYEVLRRDNHTCRYCGATAPQAEITVDHVVPVSLGGLNEPGNLVAACKDCNAGKSASSPDSALVNDVSADALRWGQAIKGAGEFLLREYRHRHDLHDRFSSHWNGWVAGPARKPLPLPNEWQKSVDSFLASGLPMEILWDCIDKAMAAKHVTADNTFRYMCGIAWRKVAEMREIAEQLIASGEGQD